MRYTINDMNIIAKSREGKCLSKEYKNNKTKIEWMCKYGHVWETTYESIRKGSWCPICFGNSKPNLKVIKDFAKKRNGDCLSTKYKNCREMLTWVCDKGHVWQASFKSIKSGSWCNVCKNHNITIEDMQMMAEERLGKCLSERYLGYKVKLMWQCSKGHIWDATPSNIRQNHWCPKCRKKISNGMR